MNKRDIEKLWDFTFGVAGCPLGLIILASIVRFLCQEYVNWWYAIASAALLVVACPTNASRFCRVVLALLLAFESVASGWLSISLWTEVPFMGKVCTATTTLETIIAFVVSGYAFFAVLSLLGVAGSFLDSGSES